MSLKKARVDSRTEKVIEVAGINIQWPWSRLLLEGKKTIETRGYPLPERLQGQWLAVIETPGPKGKKEAGIEKAQVIGLIKFSGSKQYLSAKSWQMDFRRHLVAKEDPLYAFDPSKPKYGWVVEHVLTTPRQSPPKSRGIVYSKPFRVSYEATARLD